MNKLESFENLTKKLSNIKKFKVLRFKNWDKEKIK